MGKAFPIDFLGFSTERVNGKHRLPDHKQLILVSSIPNPMGAPSTRQRLLYGMVGEIRRLHSFVSPFLVSVAIDTTRLPNGIVKAAYSAVIRVSGGGTPYSWAIVSGALPAGIRKKPSSNTTSLDLTGAPTTAGSYSFIVSVKGCGGRVDQESYRAVIQPASKRVVDLSWKPSTSNDVAGYNVYRTSGGSAWRKINVSLTAWTRYSDSTVADDTTYYYAATAVNIHGRESPRTAGVKVVIP